MRRLLSVGAILVLTFLVFLPTLHYSLVYDDIEQIVENPRITAWSYVPGYFTAHLWAHNPLDPAYYYRPVFLLWLRITDALLGPPGNIWHLTSVVTHLGATICVLLLIFRLTQDWTAAALSAGLFGIHPIHTEAVAWVSSVSEPLFTIFVVLALYFYIGRKSAISIASLVFAALAMFTKETGIIVPVLILVYEWMHSGMKRALEGSVPYLLPALLFASFRAYALGTFNPAVPSTMSTSEMILTWPRVLALYAEHLLWPVRLSLSYNAPILTSAWPLAVMIAVAAALIWGVRASSVNLRFGLAWVAITLLPALGIRYLLTNDYVHDRYLYLPTVGLALIIATALTKIKITRPLAIAACMLAIALCWATRADLRVWQDNISLFRRVLETSPDDVHAMNNLASAYLVSHHEAEALPLLRQVIALRPNQRQGYFNMARYYHQVGNYEEEARYFAIFQRILSQQAQGGLR